MVAKRNARRKLTWRESGAKYAARSRALSILLMQDTSGEPEENVEQTDGAPGPSDHMEKFIAICRVLLDMELRGTGRDSYDPIYEPGESVLRFEINSTFCTAPERTTTLVPSLAERARRRVDPREVGRDTFQYTPAGGSGSLEHTGVQPDRRE